MGVSFIQGLAISCAVTVAMTVLASLTLLPALLGFAGAPDRDHPLARRHRHRPLRPRPGGRRPQVPAAGHHRLRAGRARAHRRLRRGPAPQGGPPPASASRCTRPSPTGGAASSSTTRGARPSAVPLVLLVLAVPDLQPAPRLLRRGQLAEGHDHPPGLRPAGRRLRPRLQRARSSWPRGCTAPADPAVLAGITAAVAARPRRGLRLTGHPQQPASPTAYLWKVTPKSGPQDVATTQLVHRLRDKVLVARPGRV